MSPTATHIKFGTNLTVVDEGAGTISIHAAGGNGGSGGGGGAGSTYVHTQGTPASIWVISHDLGWFPSITVVDTGDSVIEPDIHYNNDNLVTLTFGSPTTGKAYLNPGDGAVVSAPFTTYLHTQAVASLVWYIVHNLGRYPSVTVSDVSEDVVVADAHYLSLNELQITFNIPIAGRAYLV